MRNFEPEKKWLYLPFTVSILWWDSQNFAICRGNDPSFRLQYYFGNTFHICRTKRMLSKLYRGSVLHTYFVGKFSMLQEAVAALNVLFLKSSLYSSKGFYSYFLWRENMLLWETFRKLILKNFDFLCGNWKTINIQLWRLSRRWVFLF